MLRRAVQVTNSNDNDHNNNHLNNNNASTRSALRGRGAPSASPAQAALITGSAGLRRGQRPKASPALLTIHPIKADRTSETWGTLWSLFAQLAAATAPPAAPTGMNLVRMHLGQMRDGHRRPTVSARTELAAG